VGEWEHWEGGTITREKGREMSAVECEAHTHLQQRLLGRTICPVQLERHQQVLHRTVRSPGRDQCLRKLQSASANKHIRGAQPGRVEGHMNIGAASSLPRNMPRGLSQRRNAPLGRVRWRRLYRLHQPLQVIPTQLWR
jgi:hypothetical protein